MSNYQQYGGNPYGGDDGYGAGQYQSHTSNPYEGGYGQQASYGQSNNQTATYNQSYNQTYNQSQSYDQAPAQGLGLLGSSNTAAPPANLQQQTSNYSQADSQYSQQGRAEQGYGAPAAPAAPSVAPLSNQAFLARIDDIKRRTGQLTSNIADIATLHQRRIASPDNTNSSALEAQISSTQILNTGIKDDIKSLEKDQLRDPHNNVKKTQIRSLKESFQKQLQDYQRQENDYEKRYREAIGRQYRIVNPQATDAEVYEAENANWGNEGVFQTALKTNRVGAASSVLGNVRARHNDIIAIEQSMLALTQLFQQLDEAVILQDETVKTIEVQAQQAHENTQNANKQIDTAHEHARRARRLKWWLTLVIVIIILILGGALGGYFGSRAARNNNNNNNNNQTNP